MFLLNNTPVTPEERVRVDALFEYVKSDGQAKSLVASMKNKREIAVVMWKLATDKVFRARIWNAKGVSGLLKLSVPSLMTSCFEFSDSVSSTQAVVKKHWENGEFDQFIDKMDHLIDSFVQLDAHHYAWTQKVSLPLTELPDGWSGYTYLQDPMEAFNLDYKMGMRACV
jgi:hypothetical protein